MNFALNKWHVNRFVVLKYYDKRWKINGARLIFGLVGFKLWFALFSSILRNNRKIRRRGKA